MTRVVFASTGGEIYGEQTKLPAREDVARANIMALENQVPSEAYKIGTGVEASVNRLYELLREISGKVLPPSTAPRSLANSYAAPWTPLAPDAS